MSEIKMSDVFEVDKALSFPPYWSDEKCRYAYEAIISYDKHKELIAKQAEQIDQLRVLVQVATHTEPSILGVGWLKEYHIWNEGCWSTPTSGEGEKND